MPPSTPLTPARRRSVHSVRSTHRRSVTFAADATLSSASDSPQSSDKGQLPEQVSIVQPDPDEAQTAREATPSAGNTPRPSKRSSLLRSSFNASRRTLSRLKRSRSSVPVTVTEEFTVERILHPDAVDASASATASSDWGDRQRHSLESTETPDSPSTLRAKRKAFAKLARAAFGAPGRVASRASSISTRKRRTSSHAAPEPDNGQTVAIGVFVHEPSPPPPTPRVVEPEPEPEPATPAVTETTVAPATTTATSTPGVPHESLPSTAVSSPNPKKPKFRAKLNQLWTEQARAARDHLRSASRICLPARPPATPHPPAQSAESLADSGLFPLPPESSIAHSRSRSTLRRISSRLSRKSRNKSKSTVHLERIPEFVTADGQVLVNPAALADSPVSQHSDLWPDSSAPASRRQSWWASSASQFNSLSHSRFPSAVTLPDDADLLQAHSSRPVSEALFPSTLDYAHSHTQSRKPKLSIVTDRASKANEPQPKTPKSILKSPSRAFFRRRSSPLPDPGPSAPAGSKPAPAPAVSNFFLRAFNRSEPKVDLEPAPLQFESALHSTELFPLPSPAPSPLSPPAPAYRPPSPHAAPASEPAPAHEFFFPSEKPTAGCYAPDLIPLTVTDEHGNAVWYIENEPTSALPAPIPIPFIPPVQLEELELSDKDNMGAKDFYDNGIDYAQDEDDIPDDFEWFENRPPKPEQPMPPRTTSTLYQPLPSVIDENERMLRALNQAPSILYQRYHEFGQLGVFGWTSEFAELIDALKTLGFDGNMFVSTRQAALDACSRILSLRIEIKMQIITIYLTNQISRLRRFLDADKQWNDYPPVDFPTDPYAVESG